MSTDVDEDNSFTFGNVSGIDGSPAGENSTPVNVSFNRPKCSVKPASEARSTTSRLAENAVDRERRQGRSDVDRDRGRSKLRFRRHELGRRRREQRRDCR